MLFHQADLLCIIVLSLVKISLAADKPYHIFFLLQGNPQCSDEFALYNVSSVVAVRLKIATRGCTLWHFSDILGEQTQVVTQG